MPVSGEFDIKSLKYHQKETVWHWNSLKRSIIYDSSNFTFIICTIQYGRQWAKIILKISFGTCLSLNILNTCAKAPWLFTKWTIFLLQPVLHPIWLPMGKYNIEDIIWGLGMCLSLNILNTCAKVHWLFTKYMIFCLQPVLLEMLPPLFYIIYGETFIFCYATHKSIVCMYVHTHKHAYSHTNTHVHTHTNTQKQDHHKCANINHTKYIL